MDGEQQEWVVEHRSVEKFGCTGTCECEIIVLNGNVTCPSLRPTGHFLVLKNGRRCFADDLNYSSNGKQTVLSLGTDARSVSFMILFHRRGGRGGFVSDQVIRQKDVEADHVSRVFLHVGQEGPVSHTSGSMVRSLLSPSTRKEVEGVEAETALLKS